MTTTIVRGICSNCEKETNLEFVTKEEVINVRREPIKLEIQYSKCVGCGDEVFDPNLNPDPFDLAYREYRRRHALLQPEEIINWRNAHKLTQSELAKLLGLGIATISRYENGALQDESHDKLLRLAMNPSCLLNLIEKSKDIFPDTKKKRLMETLRGIQTDLYSIDNTIMLHFGNYEPNEYNGYRKLSLAKLYNAILFFCKDGVLKTKLNKLLFYADFKHFKENALSITGAEYAHIPFGPAPDNYEMYYASLKAQKAIEFVEEPYPSGYVGEIIKATKEPDLNLFSPSELRTLASVKEDFKNYNAKKVTSFSHKEIAYQQTHDCDIISYSYANQLNY